MGERELLRMGFVPQSVTQSVLKQQNRVKKMKDLTRSVLAHPHLPKLFAAQTELCKAFRGGQAAVAAVRVEKKSLATGKWDLLMEEWDEPTTHFPGGCDTRFIFDVEEATTVRFRGWIVPLEEGVPIRSSAKPLE
uniref:Uncharacterized protein n=1 Tax=uncultured organism MedDCM-OCT-S08-C169 TaxID=743633 RepID=D6PJ54_9ZZZZ|nr:hypothetical protein [uncultured organism MedDCM-OCT-S08-C169]